MYITTHTVRFNEVDGANIVFFSRLFEICHVAFEGVLDEVGHGLRDVLENRDWRMPVVHADADYISPMRLGDVLTIEISVKEGGGTSLTWNFAIKGADGGLRAQARQIHAAVDGTTFKSVPVPAELLDGLRAQGLLAQ